ncbi:MAG: hypothetical protein ACD_50C00313G0002 [uncultured bacterium]|nr:MAG: hypothetical protein ACD_50C00313G0002 [uncultured bacterium]
MKISVKIGFRDQDICLDTDLDVKVAEVGLDGSTPVTDGPCRGSILMVHQGSGGYPPVWYLYSFFTSFYQRWGKDESISVFRPQFILPILREERGAEEKYKSVSLNRFIEIFIDEEYHPHDTEKFPFSHYAVKMEIMEKKEVKMTYSVEARGYVRE